MKYSAILWDFYGVFSNDKFYSSLSKNYPTIHKFIEDEIWKRNTNNFVNRWMKAEITSESINRYISDKTGIDFGILTNSFLNDITSMRIETGLIPIIGELKTKGIKVGMVTDNMDVFTDITVPLHHLSELFDNHIYNSFDYRKLKKEGLFKIALKKMDIPDFSKVLLIDDSDKARNSFEKLGGSAYPYTTFEDFKKWADQNLVSQK